MTEKRIGMVLMLVMASMLMVDSAEAQDKSFKKRRKGSTELPPYDELNAIWKVEGEVIEYDPNTKVYVDALFFRVHAEGCPSLVLKDKKQTMTLAEADKAGAAIGSCCLPGYQRKHPLNMISDDHVMYGPARNGVHYFGCIYIENAGSGTQRKTVKEWKAEGERFCHRCGGRRRVGPSYTLTEEEWQKVTAEFKKIEEESERQKQAFAAPEGWTPKPIDPVNPPSPEDLEMIVRGALKPNVPSKLETLYFKDRVAMHETLFTKRFFFGPPETYYAYRATGDQRLLDQLLRDARYRKQLCDEVLEVYQKKADDSEGVPAVFDMVAWSRIALQKAVKHPGTVSEKEIGEAEGFLKTVIKVLKPTWEGNDDLDPDMGIPKKVADDFRRRAFNRAATGIGTIAMAAVALEDLQKLKKTAEYQSTIDRYRKCATEWVKNWKNVGCLYTEADGKTYFYYPYGAGEKAKVKNGLKFYGADDRGHFGICMMGAQLIYEAMPESGVDDDLMTALANSVYHNSGTKNGSIQCPSADKIRPKHRHPWEPKPLITCFVLEAWRDGLIEAQFQKLSEKQKNASLSSHQGRLRVLHAQYMKALRKDRSLIHLGETFPDFNPNASDVLFEDPMAANWQENWFLDGANAVLEHRDEGLAFITEYKVDKNEDRAGFDAQHAVLWTRQEFEGDIRITYTYTRLPGCSWQKLIYVQAQGIGEKHYDEDIYEWRDDREVALMSDYYTYMDLISLSLRDQVRCKRYPTVDMRENRLPCEFKPRGEHTGWPEGHELDVVLEKRKKSISLYIKDTETDEVVIDHTWDLTDEEILEDRDPEYIEKGRIGIRLMGGHKILMRDFKVTRLPEETSPE